MKELLASEYFWKSIYILAFMLGLLTLAGGVIKFLRQRSYKEAREPLTYYHGLTLDPKRRLIVIKWQQKEYLVMIGPSGEQVIDQRSLEAPSASTSERIAPTFSKPYELTGHHAVS